MKSSIGLCCGILVFAAVQVQSANSPATAPTPVPGSPEAELVSLMNEWSSAILAKDRAKLEALMSPEFTLQGWGGSWQVERPQWLDNTLHSYNIEKYHHADVVPHVYGDFAAITSKWYWRGTRGHDEKKPFEEHGYCVDLWRQAGGRWQVLSRITIIIPDKKEPAPQEK